MKLRTFVVASTFVLGSVGVAEAQPAAPAPPPAAPPPAATAKDAPAASPADPSAPPAAPPSAGAAPAAPAAPGASPAPGAPAAQPGAAPSPPPASAVAPPPEPPPQQQPVQQPPPSIVWQPAGGPITTGGAQPDAVAEAKDEAVEKKAPPLRWRGTTFTWNQSGTTTIFGVGRDYIGSEDESYGWSFLLKPNFFIVDLPKDKLVASGELGTETELTDGSTTEKRETNFLNLTLGLKYTRTLFSSGGADEGEYETKAGIGGRLRIPFTKFSGSQATNQGKYLTTALGPSVSQKIKILGNKAKGLNNITLVVDAEWAHIFSDSYTPTDSELNYQRQNASGQTILSDQLTGRSYSINSILTTVAVAMPLVGDLSFEAAFAYAARFKHDFKSGGPDGTCDVIVEGAPNGGCVQAERDPTRTLYQPATIIDFSLAYPILEVVDVKLGYQNLANAIGPDGQRRNVFYSPDAQFYLDLTANLDVIYSKVSGRDKKYAAEQKLTASR